MNGHSSSKAPISGSQCRHARFLLGWSQKDLAQHSGIDPHTISRFERSRSNPHKVTIDSLQHTFEIAGVVFSAELPGAQVRRA